MTKRATLAATVVTGATLLLLSAPALATWGTTASGAGTAGARTLATPEASNSCTKNSGPPVTYTILTSWAAVTGAATYMVERAVGTGAYSQVQSSAALSYTATEDSTKDVTYNYRVTALVGASWDSASDVTTRTINNGANCGNST